MGRDFTLSYWLISVNLCNSILVNLLYSCVFFFCLLHHSLAQTVSGSHFYWCALPGKRYLSGQ